MPCQKISIPEKQNLAEKLNCIGSAIKILCYFVPFNEKGKTPGILAGEMVQLLGIIYNI